ncbi:MAG: hypothetical protein U9R06_02025 [Patescibacteria group bacterium]|nr:hypothetical protein [Patescibacteria group bacterium]
MSLRLFDKAGKARVKAESKKKYLLFLLIIPCFLICFFYSSNNCVAQDSVRVGDQLHTAETEKQSDQDKASWLENTYMWFDKWKQDEWYAVAWKAALSTFLNRLAYDTATYLATGDKGQAPMFNTDDVGDFITNAADYAAGDLIEALGRTNDWGKFNLCNPNINVKLRINAGLIGSRRPKKPACTFSKMLDNWEAELSNPNFLNDFQDMFNPWSNDLGIALTVQSGVEQAASQAANNALSKWMKDTFEDVTEPISGKIKTPAKITQARAVKAFEDSTTVEKSFTGNILADAIGTFANTLIAKLIEEWFNKGLVDNFPDKSYNWGNLSGLYDYSAGSAGGGIQSAEDRFRVLLEPKFNERGNYDILEELVSCPDPNKAGPTDCVITENFRRAITDKMTVGEAMRQGYLNPQGVFGFLAGSVVDNPPEPAYYEGYPYRSMIILRKFRILPVGWELAAEHIKNFGSQRMNLENLVNCFSLEDSYGDSSETKDWCEGLVDPNWVLKAPLNYCRREGPGPEIISQNVIGKEENSRLSVERDNNYCADEQACIIEGDDDSCDYYGYCTEERRKWNFNAKSCDPKYNTCQTFRGRDGHTNSYLENTLDFAYCGEDNVGCLAYCEEYDDIINNTSCGDSLYLDAEAEECDKDDEGCHEFIRTKEGLGANLLHNSSFEDEAGLWPELFGSVINTDSYHGINSYALSSDLNKSITIGASGNSVAAKIFTLSLYAKNCEVGAELAIENATTSIENGVDWEFHQISYVFPENFSGNEIDITVKPGGFNCQIDAVKLERGSAATVYSDYRENGLAYLKLAPDYLGCDGIDDPEECNDYVRLCSAGEEGCNLFTSLTDGMSVPAKVISTDYCPAECVGYDEYLQTETYFDSQQTPYFIPNMAVQCSSQSVGCDEFTNLDKLGEGAEAREYYKELKQCRKPDVNCADFYTWEGSAETGYQLRVYSLQKDTNGPYLINNGFYDGLSCADESDYNLTLNPMCREFYDKNGNVFYRFYPYTVACSDNCHPYRRTDKNIAENLDALTCDAAGSGIFGTTDNQFFWDDSDSICYFCKNGGEWNSQHEACLYNAIPGEGIKCSAQQVGCREYSGNAGANMRVLFINTFEYGTADSWKGAVVDPVNSPESLMVGEHSLSASENIIYKILGNLVEIDKNYVLSFLAKGNGATQITNIGFGSSTVNLIKIPFAIGTANLDSEWQLYEFNLANLNNPAGDYVISPDEKIFIQTDSDGFFIDDIRLTEITDRYYLIKNNWNLPDACWHDVSGNPVPADYNLGCDAYRDKENKNHYLRKFTQLCSESAVGCEMMIDTHNYSGFSSKIFHLGDRSKEIIPADKYAYVVYDRDKRCNARDKGCQFLGKPYRYDNEFLYTRVYLKNDPDKYFESDGDDYILCFAGEAGCDIFTYAGGSKYFKNPGDEVCEWRQKTKEGEGGWDWYKKQIKRCGSSLGGHICLSDNDCSGGVECILEEVDVSCSIVASPFKTIGIGGQGNVVAQPDNWAGLCPAAEAGCAEYVDPVSRSSANSIFNADFSQNVDNNSVADGWSNKTQNVRLEPYTLYRLAGSNESKDNTATLACLPPEEEDPSMYILDALSNEFNASEASEFKLNIDSSGTVTSVLLYIGASGDCSVNVIETSGKIELKKVLVDYQLKNKIDKISCNGKIDFEKGCVLFNERIYKEQDGFLASLTWDADLTIDDGSGLGLSPQVGQVGAQDSNLIIKVSPDRVCDKWLACRSYVKDEDDNPVCYDIGLCDSVDENGNCNSYLITNEINQTYPDLIASNLTANMSGYVKVGIKTNILENDYYPLGAMEQIGGIAEVPNGSFEFYGSNGYPIGWMPFGDTWDDNKFSVINDPVKAQAEGVKYPVEGKSFLKFGSEEISSFPYSEFIDVEPNTDYILSAYINTINFLPKDDEDNVYLYVNVDSFNSEGENISDGIYDYDSASYQEAIITDVSSGQNWNFYSKKFKTGNNITRLKLQLIAAEANAGDCTTEIIGQNNCVGNIYIDAIKIRPALKIKDNTPASAEDNNFLYSSQTCRLYPKSDSLSCEYYEDSGILEKGWLGYCLEYDRYPGNSDTCLLWYPINKVKGDGLEEGAGYSDRFPLYYCIEFDTGIITFENSTEANYCKIGSNNCCNSLSSNDNCFVWSGGHVKDRAYQDWLNCTHHECVGEYGQGMPGYIMLTGEPWDFYIWEYDYTPQNDDCSPMDIYLRRKGESDYSIHIFIGCMFETKLWLNIVDNTYAANKNVGLLSFKTINSDGSETPGVFVPPYTLFDKIKWYSKVGFSSESDRDNDLEIRRLVTPYLVNDAYCLTFVQAVTQTGQNKYWSGRVYQGGDFTVDCQDPWDSVIAYVTNAPYCKTCDYTSDYRPFGSAVPPRPTSNPYEWDSDSLMGIQPIPYIDTDELTDQSAVRSGQVYTIDNVKNLFAQSYGIWNWTKSDKRYMPDNSAGNGNWGPPTEICIGNRPAYDSVNPMGDYCAILPQIQRIKVNGEEANIELKSDRFVSLTFNSIVDSQQQPMVMYGIKWGDGEDTIITGAEMRNRPNADNPHSIYHLYSYWDLKAKNAVNQVSLGGLNTIYCGNPGNPALNNTGVSSGINCPVANSCCMFKPSVKIKDNWGWCNNGVNFDSCPADGYESYPGWVIVTEN